MCVRSSYHTLDPYGMYGNNSTNIVPFLKPLAKIELLAARGLTQATLLPSNVVRTETTAREMYKYYSQRCA
jgi:hypothetical protein